MNRGVAGILKEALALPPDQHVAWPAL